MFQVDVKFADFVNPGQKVKVLEKEYTAPDDGKVRAIVAAEAYGNTEKQHEVLKYVFNHDDAIETRLGTMTNGHEGILIVAEVDATEMAAALAPKEEKAVEAVAETVAEPVAAVPAEPVAGASTAVAGASDPSTDPKPAPAV